MFSYINTVYRMIDGKTVDYAVGGKYYDEVRFILDNGVNQIRWLAQQEAVTIKKVRFYASPNLKYFMQQVRDMNSEVQILYILGILGKILGLFMILPLVYQVF